MRTARACVPSAPALLDATLLLPDLCMQALLDEVRQLIQHDYANSASLPPSIITALIHALSLVIPLTPIQVLLDGVWHSMSRVGTFDEDSGK